MSIVSMTMKLECFLAVVLAFGLVESVYDAQELQISIGIVTSRSGNVGEVYSYTETFSPRKDVLITTYFNWTTVDPRDPFVSIRKLLISSSGDADLSIWSVEWELANFLTLSLDLYNGRTLLWYGGVVRELVNTDYPRSQKVELLDDCPTGVSLQTSRSIVGSSLSSDFEALQNHYGRVLNDLLHSLQWDHFVLVTDDNTARHISNLLSLVMGKKHKIKQLQVHENSGKKHIHKGIRDAYYMHKNGQVHFLLFCELDCVFQVVKEAQRFDSAMGGKTALSYMSRWLIVTLPEHRDKIEGQLTELNNIAVLTAASSTKSQLDQKYISDLVQDAIIEVFTVSNLSRTSPDVESHHDKYLNTTIGALIASIRRQDRSHLCVTCPVFEIQTALWKRDGRRFTPVGTYVLSEGLLLHSDGVFPNTKFGFNNQTLNIATNLWPLFVAKEDATGEYEGLCMDLLLELSIKMNFSYTLYEPADGEFGVRRSDGHWTGLVGELELRRANITIAPLAITADREEVVDFAFPFYYDYNGVLIKKPDASELKWRTLVDIFTYPVYIGIAMSWPVMTVLVYVSERFDPFYRAYTTEELQAYPGLHNFQDTLWYMYGALLTHGGLFLPKSHTGRTLLGFWWLYSMIMVASYSGNLIASLTVTTDRSPFNSLKEMIGQSDYKWGTTSGTYLNQLFEDSNLTEYRKIWEGMNFFPESMSDSHEAHIEMVKKGGYAYMNDKSGMVKWVSKECDLVLIKEEFFPMTYGIGLPNHSPYKDMFSHQMLKIIESGLMHIWKQKWWPKRNFCSGSVKAVAKRIELVDVQSAFYILFIGGVLGVILVLIENIREKYLESKGTKHDNSNVEHFSTSTFPVQVTDQTL